MYNVHIIIIIINTRQYTMCIIPGSVAEVPDQHGLDGVRVGDITMTDKENLDHHAKRHSRVLQTTPTK